MTTAPSSAKPSRLNNKTITMKMMEIKFAIASLGVSGTQEVLLEASYELTNQLGVIKKRVIKLQRRNGTCDNSTEL